MKANRPSSAVRRDIFVGNQITKCSSSVGAAYFHVAPDAAGKFIGWQCYKYSAPTALAAAFGGSSAEPKRIVTRVEKSRRRRARWQRSCTEAEALALIRGLSQAGHLAIDAKGKVAYMLNQT